MRCINVIPDPCEQGGVVGIQFHIRADPVNKVVYVNKEKQRAQNGALGDSCIDFFPVRLFGIDQISSW